MGENSPTEINFYLARYSIKEAKKRYCRNNSFYIIDIFKIIKELGYDLEGLTPEGEFVINYSIQKKITQGIYSTRSNDILVTYKELGEPFIKNLKILLEEFDPEEFKFNIEWAEILE